MPDFKVLSGCWRTFCKYVFDEMQEMEKEAHVQINLHGCKLLMQAIKNRIDFFRRLPGIKGVRKCLCTATEYDLTLRFGNHPVTFPKYASIM